MRQTRQKSDFFIGEVTCRVGSPDVIMNSLGSDAEVAIAYIEPFAFGASAFEKRFAVFEPCHKWLRGVLPNFAKGLPADVSERVMPPELIRVNITLVVYVSNSYPRTVPAVHC